MGLRILSPFEDRTIPARYYAELGRKRFFVFGLSQRGEPTEWQVREDHEWLGIAGGSGLIESFEDRASAKEEAKRLNALDAESLKESVN